MQVLTSKMCGVYIQHWQNCKIRSQLRCHVDVDSNTFGFMDEFCKFLKIYVVQVSEEYFKQVSRYYKDLFSHSFSNLVCSLVSDLILSYFHIKFHT